MPHAPVSCCPLRAPATVFGPPGGWLRQRTERLADGTLAYVGYCRSCQAWRPLGLFLAQAHGSGAAWRRTWRRSCWWCRHSLTAPRSAP